MCVCVVSNMGFVLFWFIVGSTSCCIAGSTTFFVVYNVRCVCVVSNMGFVLFWFVCFWFDLFDFCPDQIVVFPIGFVVYNVRCVCVCALNLVCLIEHCECLSGSPV